MGCLDAPATHEMRCLTELHRLPSQLSLASRSVCISFNSVTLPVQDVLMPYYRYGSSTFPSMLNASTFDLETVYVRSLVHVQIACFH